MSTPFLIIRLNHLSSAWTTVGGIVFLFFSAWSFYTSIHYHSAREDQPKWFWKRMDHIAIYGMIAGTYTPFILHYLEGDLKMRFLIFIWALFMLGAIFKYFTAGRFKIFSTLIYILMGLSILLVRDPFFNLISTKVAQFLIYGGLSYFIGALVYLIPNWKYAHPLWHLFVMIGAGCHWWAIWCMG